jgi:hypothetical protein
LMKCSASSFGGSPRRLPVYLPRGMSVIQADCRFHAFAAPWPPRPELFYG